MEGSDQSPTHLSQWSQQNSHPSTNHRHKPGNAPIRDELQHGGPGNTEGGASNTSSPLGSIQPGDAERCPTDKDDEHLSTYHQGVDHHEPSVSQNALEDIEFVVQSTTVQLVENLHPDEGVEDDGVELGLLLVTIGMILEDPVACKVESKTEGELVD